MKKHWKQVLISVLVIMVVAAGATVGVRAYLQSRVLIPNNIIRQANFLIFVPLGAQGVTYDKSSVKIDNSIKVVSFSVYCNGIKIAFGEQQEPSSFTDVPQVYDELLNRMREYQDIDTAFGTVTLTRPVELNGGQSAVVDSKGTLIFAQPTKDLTENDWQNIFNNMQLVR